jgi:hypothetical protein
MSGRLECGSFFCVTSRLLFDIGEEGHDKDICGADLSGRDLGHGLSEMEIRLINVLNPRSVLRSENRGS